MAEALVDRRRSRRHEVRVPVVLTGTDEAGRDFFDRAEIISVSQHGARLRTRFLLKVGTAIKLLLPNKNETKRLRVVWRSEAGSFEAGLVGVEFLDPNDFWDVSILPVRD